MSLMTLFKRNSRADDLALKAYAFNSAIDNNIAMKSAQGDTGWYATNAVMPSKVQVSNVPWELMSLYHGYPAACIDKITRFCGNVPLHVYGKVDKGMGSKLLTRSRVLVAKELTTVQGCKSLIRQADTSDIVTLTEGPVIDLLKRPYGDMSWPDWVNVVLGYILILGNSHILKHKKNGVIAGLEPLMSEYVRGYTDSDNNIVRWEYNPTAERYVSHIYSPDDIIHIRTPRPGSILHGRSPLEACQKAARLLDEINNHLITLANNFGQPGALVTIRGKVADQAAADKLKQQFLQKFRGLNRGEPMVNVQTNPDEGIDVNKLGLSPKDLAYIDAIPFERSEVCAAFGVPEDLIHSTNSNRASSTTAMTSFMSDTIGPQVSSLCEQLNAHVMPHFDDNMYIGFDAAEIISGDPQLQSQVVSAYYKAGVYTRAEARATVALADTDDGKAVYYTDMQFKDKATQESK